MILCGTLVAGSLSDSYFQLLTFCVLVLQILIDFVKQPRICLCFRMPEQHRKVYMMWTQSQDVSVWFLRSCLSYLSLSLFVYPFSVGKTIDQQESILPLIIHPIWNPFLNFFHFLLLAQLKFCLFKQDFPDQTKFSGIIFFSQVLEATILKLSQFSLFAIPYLIYMSCLLIQTANSLKGLGFILNIGEHVAAQNQESPRNKRYYRNHQRLVDWFRDLCIYNLFFVR